MHGVRTRIVAGVAALGLACSSSGSSPPAAVGDASPPTNGDGGAPPTGDGGEAGAAIDGGKGSGDLASKYPGDVGIGSDPAVVWAENFEEGSVALVTARYDNVNNAPGMTLLPDVPAKSSGASSMKLTASGDAANATDFYKELAAGYDEWFVRWYAKYEANIQWHHSGVWFGGYDPPTTYPNPQAGLKPAGNDRLSIAIEPAFGVGSPGARFDFYDYWMQMHSWMDVPSGTTAYYGNALVHQNAFTLDEGQWSCLEVHVKLNADTSSAAGAVLEVWKNGALLQRFDGSGPKGYWIKDKFCPPGADGTECTSYPAPNTTILDLQSRSTAALKLNYFWPQNYITQAGVTGSVQYDDMLVATTRVGCIR